MPSIVYVYSHATYMTCTLFDNDTMGILFQRVT